MDQPPTDAALNLDILRARAIIDAWKELARQGGGAFGFTYTPNEIAAGIATAQQRLLSLVAQQTDGLLRGTAPAERPLRVVMAAEESDDGDTLVLIWEPDLNR